MHLLPSQPTKIMDIVPWHWRQNKISGHTVHWELHSGCIPPLLWLGVHLRSAHSKAQSEVKAALLPHCYWKWVTSVHTRQTDSCLEICHWYNILISACNHPSSQTDLSTVFKSLSKVANSQSLCSISPSVFGGGQREKGNNAKTILAIFPQSVTTIQFQPLKVL